MSEHTSPFPLEGGRVGDGGGTARKPRSRPATGSVSRARKMRKEPTVAERLLWTALRKLGANYRRQVPIGRFIADFAHLESKLLIEIDGHFHSGPQAAEKDAARTAWLASEGFRVVRFDDREVRDNLPSVVDTIVAETVSPPSPALPPSRGKGEDKGSAL